MERAPVKSSNILSVGHDPKEKILEVEFKDGSVYQYHDVDAAAHGIFVGAKSIGSHFHSTIKGSYKHSKV